MLREGGVSIVMVSYHTGAALMPAIHLALAQPGLSELVLVDNGNPRDVQARLRAMSSRNPKMVLVAGQGNVGFSRGCNLGAKYANGFYLMFLNPDCLLPENALERMVFALEKQPGAVMAGARILNADGTPQRGCWRDIMTPKNAVNEALGLHKTGLVSQLNHHEIFEVWGQEAPNPPAARRALRGEQRLMQELGDTMPDHSFPVPAISGACMFIRSTDYAEFGGLDERYFLHVEDMDFCKRIHDRGAKIILVPGVTPTHLLSTSDAPSRFVEWHKTKGFFRYFRTHYPRDPLAYVACAGALARYLVRGYLRRPKTPKALQQLSIKTLLLLSARCLPAKQQRFVGKTVLVTGATCPLGLVITGRLLAEGARVMATSRKVEMTCAITNLSWHNADLQAANVLLPEKADFAVHCAPLWTLSNALPAMKRSGVNKVIAFGSTSIFGKEHSRNAHEQETVQTLRAAEMESTERSKLLALPLCILRPTMIYGSGMDGNVSRVARTIRRFGHFPVVRPAAGLRQPVHVLDLAEAATCALLTETKEPAYNVSGGETLPYRAMVERIFITLQQPVRLISLPWLPLMLDFLGRLLQKSINGEMARRMNTDLVFPHDAATSDFGYAPRAFLAGGIRDINGELL